MKHNLQTLHFAFNPVQGFVSQARRTRDLWAGSYLLSWLAGQAMKALQDKGGRIILPEVNNDPLFRQICNPKSITFNDQASYLGSLPNRFTALVPEGVDGTICSDVIANQWACITGAVFNLIEAKLDTNNCTLWERQTEHFWECTWVMGEETSLLDQRKNLRLHLPAPESGAKCTICGERQELSGKKETKRNVINDWWKTLADNTPIIHDLDLRKNERLCAICLTKRLFPKVAQQAIGWKVPEFYPSTPYMAAVDWIIKVLETARQDPEVKNTAVALLNNVSDRIVEHAEKRTWARIKGINNQVAYLPELEKFLYVDGSMFYLDSHRLADLQLDNRSVVLEALKKVRTAMNKHNVVSASPFYSLLLMDGDNMGRMIGSLSPQRRHEVSAALAEFTGRVPDIVRDNNGMLLYVGGDDVFALLPVSTALDCARCCRKAYQCAFTRHAPSVAGQATISAAIQYTHMNTALGVVVRDGHHLLEEVAKETTGRDALACRVWKRGGPILTWTQPWSVADDGLLVQEVQQAFTDNTNEPDRFSSKFFYKLHDMFELISSGNFTGSEADIQDLLVAEYIANREHCWPDGMGKPQIRDTASGRVAKLLQLCREHRRTIADDGTPDIHSTGRYSEAGALLVRFLTRKEV